MGEMASLWGYELQDHEMDQLGQKLLFTTLELEKLKSETMAEMKKNKVYVKQLIHLLKCAIQERDEAKDQLGKLINKTLPAANSDVFPQFFQPESPLPKPVRANSSVTESNSVSDAYNYPSHGASPVESLFDAAVTSPELNFAANQAPIQDGSVVDELAKGRILPQKGMLLQAVLEAGPLLQTLLLAGPLPRWRNPPQLQPFQIPPVAIKGGDVEVLSAHSLYGGNFGNVVPGSCLSNGLLGDNGGFRLGKRHRFC